MINLNCVPDVGNMVGTSLSGGHLSQLNAALGGSIYFDNADDVLFKSRQMFIKNRIEPFRNIGNVISSALAGIINTDGYHPITSKKMLDKIPPLMTLPIMQYAPVRKLFDQGRIYGFGLEEVPAGDPYGRICSNGCVEDVAENMKHNNGWLELRYEYHASDPDITFEDMDAIVDTRQYIDHILNDTDIDPTDYPNIKY